MPLFRWLCLFLSRWLSIALFITLLSLKSTATLFFPLPAPSLVCLLLEYLLFLLSCCYFVSPYLVLQKLEKKKKGRLTPHESATMGQTKRGRKEEEAKLCSQWHKGEAERALETKSGNSARALQTERGDGEVGENTRTHSPSHTHTHSRVLHI